MVFDGKIEKSKWRESYFSDDDRSEDMKRQAEADTTILYQPISAICWSHFGGMPACLVQPVTAKKLFDFHKK